MRTDLSDWIIHFVHRRNPDNDPLEFNRDFDTLEYIPFPDAFTYYGEEIFLTDEYVENDYGLEADAPAFNVLKKILYDGIIRTSWAFRNGVPTIYGPKSAVCFTEMPLYALIEYSKTRNNQYSIEPYGIAFLKEEIFEAGARPAIYGLSGRHVETYPSDIYYNIGLRTLSNDCDIGLREMYRYVYTNLKSTGRKIDWTHEREWRWADIDERFEDFSGIPFYALNEEFSFSKIIVFVKTEEEAAGVIELLQHLRHSGTTNFEREYDLRAIENTFILSIDSLSKIDKELTSVRFDDLPLNTIPKVEKIEVKAETIEKVRNALEKAAEIAYNESRRIHKESDDNGICGWAWIITYVSNSEITQALVDLGKTSSFGKGYYKINLEREFAAQSLYIDEAGKRKAAEYLAKELGQNFTIHSDLD